MPAKAQAVTASDRLAPHRPPVLALAALTVAALSEAKKSPDRDRGLSLKTLADSVRRKRAA
jgi:hypothetical protein